MFPPSYIASVYVKGSLKNTGDGFEFTLRNNIESTMLSGVGPIAVGDKKYTGAAIVLVTPEKQVAADQISWGNMVPARVGSSVRVLVQGDPLPAGKVTVSVSVTSTDVGRITFDVQDEVAGV